MIERYSLMVSMIVVTFINSMFLPDKEFTYLEISQMFILWLAIFIAIDFLVYLFKKINIHNIMFRKRNMDLCGKIHQIVNMFKKHLIRH